MSGTGAPIFRRYRNTYFHGDFEQGWIRNFVFNGNDKPVAIRDFLTNAGPIVAIATHPTDGGLYYVWWGMEVVKVSYSLTANQRPVAVATADETFRSAPLTIQFTGGNSSDPRGRRSTLPLGFRRWHCAGHQCKSIARLSGTARCLHLLHGDIDGDRHQCGQRHGKAGHLHQQHTHRRRPFSIR